MEKLLVCCVGNASLSPTFAALFNAEAASRGIATRAMSAGLSTRSSASATAPYVVEAVRRTFPQLAGAAEELAQHTPRPLSSVAPTSVLGVCNLHEKARSAQRVSKEEKLIRRWLDGSTSAHAIARFVLDDEGYKAWEQAGQPDIASEAGQRVLDVYCAQAQKIYAVARTLVV